MAIVPDLSGTRPGRSGNIPLVDPRNRSLKERTVNDDNYRIQRTISLSTGNNVIAVEDKTRNAILFMLADPTETVYASTTVMTAIGGIPVVGSIGLELKGKAAEHPYYIWAEAITLLTVWEG